MKKLTLDGHRRRIDNINSAELGNRKYLRRTRVRDYLPGQAIYHLGDYPKKFTITPTEYDYERLKSLADNGIGLVQLHADWNDPIHYLGADKYNSHDPEGLNKFLDLCHYFGLKVIGYVSSGFFQETDPDFREEFTHTTVRCLDGMHFKYRRCSAGSAEWRDYVLPRTVAVLDNYGFDGIYNDAGMESTYKRDGRLTREGIGEYDPEYEDMLATIYYEVKRRGGIYKLHCDYNNPAPCLDKVYDYLWIGEGITEEAIGAGKTYPDFVVPCPDKVRMKVDSEYFYSTVIPFMQFPLLTTVGRPLMGGAIEPDVPRYSKPGVEHGVQYFHHQKIAEYMKDHPNGPYVYSEWSPIPDDPGDYPMYCRFLSLYRPMVEDNSVAYIELRDCEDILSPIPERVYASMFVNDEKYLAVSNLTKEDYTLRVRDMWCDRESGAVGDSFTIKPGKILFLKKK